MSAIERILARSKELGLSPRAASLASGLGATAIRDLVRNPDQDPSLETVRKLAKGLKTTPEWIAFGVGGVEGQDDYITDRDRRSTAGERQTAGAPVEAVAKLVRPSYGGIVQASSFRPISDWDDDPDREIAMEPADPEFPDAKLVIFDVAGDSMNDLKPTPLLPGHQIVCLEFESLRNRLPLRQGMVVVVEQTSGGGQLRERSVKQIEMYRDRTEFCPRSTNPKHKPIVVPYEIEDPVEGQEVAILAIVRRVSVAVPLW